MKTYLTIIEIVVAFAIWFTVRIRWALIIVVAPTHNTVSIDVLSARRAAIGRDTTISFFVITMIAFAIIKAGETTRIVLLMRIGRTLVVAYRHTLPIFLVVSMVAVTIVEAGETADA